MTEQEPNRVEEIRNKIKKAVLNPKTASSYIESRLSTAYLSSILGLSSRSLLGHNIYEDDWDVMILLDTCRVDALRELSSEYDFIDDVGCICSVGSTSPEWIASTFTDRYLSEATNTAYLSANGWAKRILEDRIWPEEHAELFSWTDWSHTLDARDIGRVEHVWKAGVAREQGDIGYDEGHMPPQYLTDRAISTWRNDNFDRMILHYIQPHSPYTAKAVEEGRSLHRYEKDPFTYLSETSDLNSVWEAYLSDLRYVLKSVSILLNNIDTKDVVISADHGEAFGEYRSYGHVAGSLNPFIRKVPWVRTEAVNNQSYVPEFNERIKEEQSVEENLKALGYKM